MRLFGRILLVVLVVSVVAVTGAMSYLRRSLPIVDGTVQVSGLSAPVDIVRDADAIPHIFATRRADGLFGLGYVHAQDRLWQMEFQRRIGFGRLSEILGPAALPQDRFLRTVGFGRAARSAWSALPPDTRNDLSAYVAGINAFLAGHHGSALPPEFTLLRFAPEPWTGADVIVWQKMMAWDLSGNYSFELLRRDLLARVGADGLAALMPPYPERGLSIIGADAWSTSPAGPATRRTTAAWPRPQTDAATGSLSAAFTGALGSGPRTVADFLLAGSRTEALGSNNWVVDGAMTASGMPLLANDPHLSARAPSIWYLAHIAAGEYDAIGATLPGAPGVVLGRNRRIAWGATNVGADVEDLYRERLDGTGRFARFGNRWEPLTIVPETIGVKGQAPVRIEVRVSRHGPLVSDAINAVNAASPSPVRRALPAVEPLALRWTALDATDTTIAALLRLGDARNWGDFTAALRDFVVPSQNFVYADVDGHIGYLAPGRIPIRAAGDGSLPAPGWTGESEWIGWVPFDDLPRAYDPPEHRIVTANDRPAPPAYPYLLGLEWAEPYRAERITDLVRKPKLTPDDFAAAQRDTMSLHAKAVLPLLLAIAVPQDADDREAVRLLRRWGYDARGDSAAAALFEAWFLHLAPALAGDELGPLVLDAYQGRYSYVTRFIVHLLQAHPSGRNWCDDVRTPQPETCAEEVGNALHAAVGDVRRRLGGGPPGWRWDALHPVVFPHQGLDSLRWLRPLVSRRAAGSGDWSTVDVGAVAADQPYEQHAIASYREIIDLSRRDDSRYLDALGESGHPLSPHYDDFLSDWRAVRHRPMRRDRAAIERGAIGHLRLIPQATGVR